MEPSTPRTPTGERFVLAGATVVDGTGAASISDGVVVIDAGSISYAGPRAGFQVPPDVEVIDLRGSTVLPGLIDLHVHSTFLSDMQAYVENGVTTVRFAGIDQPSYRTVVSRTQKGANPSPRLFTLGPMLDVSPPSWPEWALPVATAAEARQASEDLITQGVHGLIVVQRIGLDLLREIVEVAHEHALPVVGQIWRMDAAEAANAGIDQLDNSSRIAASRAVSGEALFDYGLVSERLAIASRLWTTIDWSDTQRLMEAMVRHGVAYCPTLVGFEQSAGLAGDYLESDPSYESLFGEEERTAWTRFKERGNATWSAREIAGSQMSWDMRREWIRRFRDLGGRILIGTDTPFGGIMIHRELAILRDLGMTPLEVISTATGGAAAAMRVGDRIGTLEPGKAADLLVVDGDPLADLGALRKITMVMQDGKVVHGGARN